MEKDDRALFAFCICFIVVATFCYSWEILTRTAWNEVRTFPRRAISRWNWKSNDESVVQKKRDNDPENGKEKTRSLHPRDKIAWVVAWIPGVLWLFSLIPALRFFKPSGVNSSLTTNASAVWNSTTCGLNPDVGGIGIRVGIYIPVGLAFLTLLAGLLHNVDSGAKEIGNAQLLTLFYLNFNAAKAAAARFRGLTFPEVMIVCMSIDLTAAGLQMTSSGKETLASRWFVLASGANQLAAASLVCAMLARIQHNYSFSTGNCAYVNWWGRVDSCNGPSKSTWIYFAARWCVLLHGLWLDLRYASEFHGIEKDWRLLAKGDQETDKRKSDFKDTSFQYGRIRATVFSKWVEFLPSILVAWAGIETLARRITSESTITDWGQSAALVLAIAGAIHWLYVVWQVWLEIRDPDDRKLRPVDFPRYADEWRTERDGSEKTLLDAAEGGNIKIVRQTIRYGASPNARRTKEGEKGPMTPLLYAVARDDLDLVIELISAKAPKDRADHVGTGYTPAVSLAAEKGRMKVLEHFIPRLHTNQESSSHWGVRHIFQTNITNSLGPRRQRPGTDRLRLDGNQRSSLWLAAINGHEDAVKYILGDWKCRTCEDWTCHTHEEWACYTPGAWEKKDIEQNCSQFDKTGQNLLYALAAIDQRLMMNYLVKFCSRESRISAIKTAVEEFDQPSGRKAMEALLRFRLGEIAIDGQGSTILHWVYRNVRSVDVSESMIKAHIEAGLSVDVFDNDKSSPLHVAAEPSCIREGMVDQLLNAGGDPLSKNLQNATPLSLVVEGEREDSRIYRRVDERKQQDRIIDSAAKSLVEKSTEIGEGKFLDYLITLSVDKQRWLANSLGAITSHQKFLGRPLILHALDRSNAQLFLVLLKGSGWPQSLIRPDESNGRNSELDKAEYVGQKLRTTLLQMEPNDHSWCESRIESHGGARYFDTPPREYQRAFSGKSAPNTFIGYLDVFWHPRKLKDGRPIEDGTEVEIVLNETETCGEESYSATVWPDWGIRLQAGVDNVYFELEDDLQWKGKGRYKFTLGGGESGSGSLYVQGDSRNPDRPPRRKGKKND